MEDAWPVGSLVSMGPVNLRLVGAVRSTQEEVWAKRRWLPEGAGFAAASQSEGEGRGGAAWISPRGGVYFSVMAGHGLALKDADVLGQAAALAVLRAAQEFLKAEDIFLKWPNDVVTWGPGRSIGKIAGVLVRLETAGERVERAAVGIGINVRAAVEGAALPTKGAAAVSLEGLARRQGGEWTSPRTKVLEWVAGWFGAQLARARDAPSAVRDEFAREVARAPLRARVAGVRDEFRPLGVEQGGALIVRRKSGKRATVSVEDSERLEWRIAPRKRTRGKPARRSARKPAPKSTSRACAPRVGRPQSSRARNARPALRPTRKRKSARRR